MKMQAVYPSGEVSNEVAGRNKCEVKKKCATMPFVPSKLYK